MYSIHIGNKGDIYPRPYTTSMALHCALLMAVCGLMLQYKSRLSEQNCFRGGGGSISDILQTLCSSVSAHLLQGSHLTR